MAGVLYSTFISCPGCKKEVEIFNNDPKFSMELHLQSHQQLDNIMDIDRPVIEPSEESKKNSVSKSHCSKYKDDVQLIDNDVGDQTHKYSHGSGYELRLHNDSTSRNVCEATSKPTLETPLKKKNILDDIFKKSSPEMKLHINFVDENQMGELFCNVCNIKIENSFSLSQHLKTKLHEDKIICILTEKLPNDSRHAMEFISFYKSNLCCNLCQSKVDLCSSNLHETLVNIMAHNTGKEHSSKKKNCQCDEARFILETFASVNTVVDQNKRVVNYKMQPQFECKLCLEEIKYSQNEHVLLENFVDHFSTLNHNKCLSALSVLNEFNSHSVSGKEYHNFIVTKNSIFCSACNCSIDVNIEQLISHVTSNSTVKSNRGDNFTSKPLDLDSNSTKSITNPNSTEINKEDNTSKQPAHIRPCFSTLGIAQKTTKGHSFQTILNSIPISARNAKCLVINKGEISCVVCPSFSLERHHYQGNQVNKHKQPKARFTSNLM